MFDCKDSAEIMSRGYDNALLLVTKTIDKVMTGELELKDFKCHTGAARSNPLRRVTPVKFIEEGREQVYDKEKYREMQEMLMIVRLGYIPLLYLCTESKWY